MTPVTDPAEMARKLAQIATLPKDELPSWKEYAKARGFFDGEKAALLRREKQVGA